MSEKKKQTSRSAQTWILINLKQQKWNKTQNLSDPIWSFSNHFAPVASQEDEPISLYSATEPQKPSLQRRGE